MGLLEGKAFVVTGAGIGLGRAYAMAIAAEGGQVVVNDIGVKADGTDPNESPARSVVAEIEQAGGRAVADNHDIVADADAVVAAAVDAFGRIDGVVNNAGLYLYDKLESMPADVFDRILAVHIQGMVGVTRAAWTHFLEQGSGRVVNISSSAFLGAPAHTAYGTGKGAVLGFTHSLAAEAEGSGIRANVVMPLGFTRMAEAEPEYAKMMERDYPTDLVAPFVVALLSDAVDCNGEVFYVGGGRASRLAFGLVPPREGIDGVETCIDAIPELVSSRPTDLYPADTMESFQMLAGANV